MDLEEVPKLEPTHREELDFSSIHTISGIKGTIVIRLVIGADGVPQTATLVQGMAPELDAKALEAAKKWRWPPLLHYKQLPCIITFVVNACEANRPCVDVTPQGAI